jgi:hypothetical protein
MTSSKNEWRLEASGVGATNDEGFWVGVHRRTGNLELQFGCDDNAQLPLEVLRALLSKAGLRILSEKDAGEHERPGEESAC